MSKLGEAVCPFYRNEKTSNGLKCELATFKFPDAESKTQLKEHCCDMNKHKECTLYQVMSSYYEREFNKKEVMP